MKYSVGISRIFLIAIVCIVSAFFTAVNFIKNDKFDNFKFSLGLDLKGGSDILLEINFDEYLREKIFSSKDIVARDLRKAKIGYMGLTSDATSIYFAVRNESDAPKVKSSSFKLSNFFILERLEDGRFKVFLTKEAIVKMRQSVKQQTIEIIRKRIDEKGNKEITLHGAGENRIILQIPGESSTSSIKNLLNVTAKLSFHLMDETAPFLSSKSGTNFQDSRILGPYNPRENAYYVVKLRTEIEGDSLVNAATIVNNSEPAVSFELDSIGARRFAEITRNNVGRPFAIVLDGKVLSAPVIREPIVGGAGVISGNFTLEEANQLSLLLRSGALPASVNIIEERVVGPSLGAESIKAGKLAAVFGICFVLLFMILRYKTFGLFASISLAVNLMLIITGLSILGSTLTLPGIAGIVLTVGMSVDANVLIFEKIKEVTRSLDGSNAKRKFLKAIDDGFSSSLGAIIDSNITTIATAFILYLVGFGPIKGFAVTLILGILTSMFSAIILTGTMIKTFAQYKKQDIYQN